MTTGTFITESTMKLVVIATKNIYAMDYNMSIAEVNYGTPNGVVHIIAVDDSGSYHFVHIRITPPNPDNAYPELPADRGNHLFWLNLAAIRYFREHETVARYSLDIVDFLLVSDSQAVTRFAFGVSCGGLSPNADFESQLVDSCKAFNDTGIRPDNFAAGHAPGVFHVQPR